MSDLVVGVDLGTSGPKVAVCTTDGRVVGRGAARTALRLLPGGGAEQDPDDWWSAVVTAVRSALDGLDTAAVAGVCMSAQWGGLVPVDAAGRHLHPALTWMDGRGAAYSRALTGGGLTVPGTGYNARALRRWIALTGGVPTRTGKDPVGQHQWLRHHRPDVADAAAHLLDVPEYLTMRLTGRPVAGWDTATVRWCTDNRDATAVRWHPGLVAACGFDPAQLPELVAPGSVVGTVRPGVAAELGLPAGVRVVAGTGDPTAAAVGAGAVRDHDPHLYVGTSAWLSCHVPGKRTDVRRGIASLPSVVPGRWWVATVQDVAGKAVDWLLDEVVYPGDAMRDDDGGRPGDGLDRLNALAAQAPPGSNGVVFTPWLNGERTPVDDPTVRGGWFNVSLSTTRADLARAVFEGIALNARWLRDAVERFVARDHPAGFEAVRFVGGGATSPLWCATMADVLGCTVLQVEEPRLANARGAALLAAVGLGALAWDDVPARVRVARAHEPDPARREVHDRQFAAFTGLYAGTRRVYARHNRGLLGGGPPTDTLEG